MIWWSNHLEGQILLIKSLIKSLIKKTFVKKI